MTRQLTFALGHAPAYGGDSYFVSRANEAAARAVNRWPEWPGGILLVTGPEGCGKTHLAMSWAARAGAEQLQVDELSRLEGLMAEGARDFLIEDAESITDETALFHVINWVRERDASLLMTSRLQPGRWRVTLPDLASRLKAMPAVSIDEPDDTLLIAVMTKHFSDRQIDVDKAVIDYLLPRIERSFAAVAKLAAHLDGEALARRRKISVPFAREIVTELQWDMDTHEPE